MKELPKSTRERNWGFLGSAGIWTTPSDLNKFFRAFASNALLQPQSTRQMLSPYRKLSSTSVGYGWFVNMSPRREYWMRGTEDFGHNAVLRWFPGDHNLVIIVFADTGEKGDQNETDNRLVSDAIVGGIFHSLSKQPPIFLPFLNI